MRRVILLVLDSVGIGALPDAAAYGDEDANTLVHTAAAVGGLRLPHLAALGLGNIAPIEGVPPAPHPTAAWGVMAERAPGKDTTTGHWEICGLVLERPFPVYPHGFPPEVIEPFQAAIGREILGNKPASGTEIIAELGEEHLHTGKPIVYTSADSVFQIAAHEEVIPVLELYRYCQIARGLLQGEHGVGRVIARPFRGEPGRFVRTDGRRDFSLAPPRPTLLDFLQEHGLPVLAVGKIEDIFAGRGITESVHTPHNMATLDQVSRYLEDSRPGLIFANCVDFDMLWGHRNDVQAYARGLEELDARLPELLTRLRPEDLLIITADHGCDPTTPSTDHSREQVPLLVTGPGVRAVPLGRRETFADVAATIAALLGVPNPGPGRSFAEEIL